LRGASAARLGHTVRDAPPGSILGREHLAGKLGRVVEHNASLRECFQPTHFVKILSVSDAAVEDLTRPGRSGRRRRMQAILLTSSLVIIAAMLASLAWLSSVRVRPEAGVVPVDPSDEPA
jgi:hypothetical protein